ncbi:MAG: hypothetical protein ACK5HR_06345, partial [Mycoplasmatales bacterium]
MSKKKLMSALMFGIIMGQIAVPTILNAQNLQKSELNTNVREMGIIEESDFSNFSTFGEFSINGNKVHTTGEGNGGVAMYQRLVDTSQDFSIDYTVLTNDVHNSAGVSILLSSASNIGYKPNGSFPTSGVYGNTNSTFVGLQFTSTEGWFKPGLNYGTMEDETIASGEYTTTNNIGINDGVNSNINITLNYTAADR